MSIFKAIVLGLCGALLVAVAVSVSAQQLTPETFVMADIEARQVTLEGMATRLSYLQQAADLESRAQLSEQNRMAVDTAFQRFGTDEATHAAYGTRHSDEIRAWLAANPQYQQTYDELAIQFDQLSQQFDTLQGGMQE